jgi:hypothetical protein
MTAWERSVKVSTPRNVASARDALSEAPTKPISMGLSRRVSLQARRRRVRGAVTPLAARLRLGAPVGGADSLVLINRVCSVEPEVGVRVSPLPA